jgi:hypothetical protein
MVGVAFAMMEDVGSSTGVQAIAMTARLIIRYRIRIDSSVSSV